FAAPRPVPGRLVASRELTGREAMARVLRSQTQWKLSAALFLGFGFYLGVTSWLEEILKPKGIGESGAGLVAGLITLAGMAATGGCASGVAVVTALAVAVAAIAVTVPEPLAGRRSGGV